MKIHCLNDRDPLWFPTGAYAAACSWAACARMAAAMEEGRLGDWERVFAAEEGGEIMGFCALLKGQDYPGPEYAPLLKWLFVGEEYRGRRLSEKLIEAAAAYAKEAGYGQLFLTTWHKGLYEKYGFEKICDRMVREGYSEGIYVKKV